VTWAEFCNAFRAYYIPADVMRKKRQEFMDLKQGGRSVHDYSKQFVSNAMITNDATAPTRKQRRGRLWQLHPVVLLQSIRRCTTIAPPTHPDSHSSASTSISRSSGLSTELSANTSGQHLRLYLHLRL
jgi:hypothetical protein